MSPLLCLPAFGAVGHVESETLTQTSIGRRGPSTVASQDLVFQKGFASHSCNRLANKQPDFNLVTGSGNSHLPAQAFQLTKVPSLATA
jgi:hypothetical protein